VLLILFIPDLGDQRHGSAVARLVCGFESHERLAWMSLSLSVSCECCVLSGGGLCDGLTVTQKRPIECAVCV